MLYSSWYSIQKSNLLKEEYRLEQNLKYDYVIRARFDSQLNKILICKNYNPNYLYTDKRFNLPPRMIEDWFGFGSNIIMNIYSSAFNYIEHAVNISNNFDKIFCGETLVYEMMRIHNIKHIAIDGLQHIPVRQNMLK
jgi:hypothetical protein